MFNEQEIDVFRELVNIGVGRAAALLNEMIENPIELTVPNIKIVPLKELRNDLKENDMLSAVKLDFSGSFDGIAQLVFPKESATNLVSLLTGENLDSADISAMRMGTLSEVGNILLNSVLGSISNMISGRFDYSIPVYVEDNMSNLLSSNADDEVMVLFSHTHFRIKNLMVEGEIILILSLGSMEKLKDELDKLNS